MQKTPESITRAAMKEPLCPQAAKQVQGGLPPIYKVREKVSTKLRLYSVPTVLAPASGPLSVSVHRAL